jgi:hypothetical protein
VNFRVAIPKAGRQRALNPQVIEVQFDFGDVPWEMALHVAGTHVEPGDPSGLPLRFHDHNHPFH